MSKTSVAKEMFEELGFELELNLPYYGLIEKNKNNLLGYTIQPYKKYNDERKEVIIFDLNYKTYKTYGISNTSLEITEELHQAIHQQMKELGWL